MTYGVKSGGGGTRRRKRAAKFGGPMKFGSPAWRAKYMRAGRTKRRAR